MNIVKETEKENKYTCEKCEKGCDVIYLDEGEFLCEDCFFKN